MDPNSRSANIRQHSPVVNVEDLRRLGCTRCDCLLMQLLGDATEFAPWAPWRIQKRIRARAEGRLDRAARSKTSKKLKGSL